MKGKPSTLTADETPLIASVGKRLPSGMEASRVKNFILPLGGALLLSGVAGTIYYYLTKKVMAGDGGDRMYFLNCGQCLFFSGCRGRIYRPLFI